MRLLFLHAAGSSGDMWVQQRLAFAGAHELRTPDLPGHGRSQEPALESIPEMAAWVAREHAPIGEAVVIGHSLGASVAMALAAEHPPRALVLIGAARRSRVRPGDPEAIAADPTVAVRRLYRHGFAEGARAALVEKASAYLEKVDPQTLRRDFAAAAAFDATPYLARIQAPTLVVSGTEDRLTPVEEGRAVAEGIAGAHFVSVPGAGHMVMLERPRELNAAIEEHLRGL